MVPPNAFQDAPRRHPRQLLKSWYVYAFQIPRLPEWGLRSSDYYLLRRGFAQIPNTSAADIARCREAWAQPGALEAMIGWYRALFRATLARRGHQPPLRIASPTLVIWGERDAFLDTGCNDTLPRYVRDLEVRDLPASHWVQLDLPDEVNRLLRAFLA